MKRILLALAACAAAIGMGRTAIAGLCCREPCPYYQGGGFYHGWDGWRFYPHYRGFQCHYRGTRPLPYPCCDQQPAIPGPPVGGYYYDGEQIGPGKVTGQQGFGAPD